MKKITNLLILGLLVSVIITSALNSISLSEWTVKCFKNVPENFKEENYRKDHNTLTYEEFESIINQFIKNFKEDINFKNKNFWVNQKEPPAWMFDSEAKEWVKKVPTEYEITYPYVQKITINLGEKICFIGDLHGSLHSLLRSLWRLLLIGYIDDNLKLKEGLYLVFSGDYTDRGIAPVETLYTLSQLKLANWNNVFLCRGNHDSISHVKCFNFFNNLLLKIEVNKRNEAEKKLTCFSTLLPHALFIKTENSCILCAHGGADESFNPMKLFDLKNSTSFEHLEDVHHYKCINGYGTNLFMWRDYENESAIQGALKYLDANGICAIFRGHQHHESPFGFFMLKRSQINESHYVLPHWTDVVEKTKIDKNEEFSIFDSSWIPIFTLISAPGNYTTCDCFAILSTGANEENWKLKPYEFALDAHSSDLEYAKISEDDKKLIKTEYQIYETGPFTQPVSEELLSKAKNVTLKAYLINLKESLATLKIKLELLNTKLEKLHAKLKKTA